MQKKKKKNLEAFYVLKESPSEPLTPFPIFLLNPPPAPNNIALFKKYVK